MHNLFSRLRKNRAAATVLGFVLITLGLLLSIPGVPGPGLVIVFFGLVVLGEHFHWAKRMTQWLEKKFAKVWPRKQS